VTVDVTSGISGQKRMQVDVAVGHSELVVVIVTVGQDGKTPPGRVPRKLVVEDGNSPPGRVPRFVIVEVVKWCPNIVLEFVAWENPEYYL
jgi:hypothetical protein